MCKYLKIFKIIFIGDYYMKRLIVGIVLVLGMILSSGTVFAKAGGKVVKIAINNVPNPPFSYVDEKGTHIGYTIDYLKELEKKLPEYDFQYEAIDSTSMLIATDTGKYALTANYFFKNPEREKKYLFPDKPFGYSVTGLAVKTERNDIKTLDDIVGKKLVPMTPVSGLLYILKDYNIKHPGKEVKIETIDNISTADGLRFVDSGRYDVLFINVHNFDDAQKQLKYKLKISGIISKEPVWIILNKSQTELKTKIDIATAELVKNGTLSKYSVKWFGIDFFKDLDLIKKGYQFRQH
jgi:L-cystine transport system substrate-binding protein